MPLGAEVGLSPSDIVLDGDLAPLPQKGGGAPNFQPMSIVASTARWTKMPLGMEVVLGTGHIVLDADPAPPLRHTPAQFSVRICCGQMTGWIKMPLGTEVVLSPGYIVLDGDPAPPLTAKGAQHPLLFSAHVYCGHGRPSQLLLSSYEIPYEVHFKAVQSIFPITAPWRRGSTKECDASTTLTFETHIEVPHALLCGRPCSSSVKAKYPRTKITTRP